MNKRTTLLLSLLLTGTIQPAAAFDVSAFNQFQARITPSEGVYNELAKFSSRKEKLTATYQDQIVALLNKKVFAEKAKALKSLDAGCTEYVKVNFIEELPDRGEIESSAAALDFESGLIRIETAACFKQSTPAAVLAIFSNPAFQDEAISTIMDTRQEGASICEETEVLSIGRSHYCYRPETFNSDTLALNHHFNSWNDPSKKLVPVYYREVLTSAHKTRDGVAFHMVAYIRSVKLGFKKIFAKSAIEQEQANSMNLLKTKLNDH